MDFWLYAIGFLFIAMIASLVLTRFFHQRLHQQLSPSRIPIAELPKLDQGRAQTVRFPTQGNLTLEGWWIQGQQTDRVAILTHGWGANRAALLPLVPLLIKAGWSVLLFDVRNHGNSDEDTFSSMPRFAEDIDAAIAWLKAQHYQSITALTGASLPRVALIGHSVGAAATLLAASRRDDISAVVSLSSFAHPADMMKRWLAEKGIPFFPLGWYVLGYVERVIGHQFDDIAPIQSVTTIQCPILIVHGKEDEVIPIDDVYTLISKTDRVLLKILEGGHDLTPSIIEHGYELVHFLENAVPNRITLNTSTLNSQP